MYVIMEENMDTTLIIMAAGIGSRFGTGIKQLAKMAPNGEIIMDYSIHDAIAAGFRKIIFVIRHDIEQDFREVIGNRIEQQTAHLGVSFHYAFQELEDLPAGYSLPKGRSKPWGTGQAVLCCREILDGPFAVINADDYYGRDAFQKIYDFLSTHEDDDKFRYTMVGYQLENTLTENGHVARGVCTTNEAGELVKVEERTRIEKKGDGAAYTEDEGATWTDLPKGSIVSMNMWGFTASILQEIKNGFASFLEEGLKTNPLKCEYFLPTVVSNLLEEDRATVSVLTSADKWYGVTYKEDKPVVVAAIKQMKENGLYPEKLWGEE